MFYAHLQDPTTSTLSITSSTVLVRTACRTSLSIGPISIACRPRALRLRVNIKVMRS